jgi:hypothetical protein
MTYQVAYNPVLGNALVGVSTNFESVPEGILVETIDGDIPDLSKHVWSEGSLRFGAIASNRELSKREWRLLFTDIERPLIDKFNATFENNPMLTEEQRDAIRSGLEDYKAASILNKDDPATCAMLWLYISLGILTPNRVSEILS